MKDSYEPQPYYPAVPKTMEQLVSELFNPPTKKPFFKGYEPNFYFKPVNSLRSDTNQAWEPK
jgi:hypothetical protein